MKTDLEDLISSLAKHMFAKEHSVIYDKEDYDILAWMAVKFAVEQLELEDEGSVRDERNWLFIAAKRYMFSLLKDEDRSYWNSWKLARKYKKEHSDFRLNTCTLTDAVIASEFLSYEVEVGTEDLFNKITRGFNPTDTQIARLRILEQKSFSSIDKQLNLKSPYSKKRWVRFIEKTFAIYLKENGYAEK